MLSPGRSFKRSRNTQTISCPASLAITCVSYPVGSTTMTWAGIASGPPSVTCSGRTPMTISEPAPTGGAAASGILNPEAVTSVGRSPPSRRPLMKFIAGEPMNPATNRLAGES